MRRRSDLLALLALAGCNEIYGLDRTQLRDGANGPVDRDRDDVDDATDPCIAGAGDQLGDLDMDEVKNADDPCPFDFEISDTDNDGLADQCDPYRTAPGDRRRCLMTFQNPVINRELWIPRGDPAAWNLLGVGALAATTTGTLVAAERIEAPATTTFDVMLSSGPPMMASESAITLWLRTGTTAKATDVGCELRGSTSSYRAVLRAATPVESAPVNGTVAGGFRIQATISPGAQPGMANVRCTIRFGSQPTGPTVAAEVALPAGNVGLAVDHSYGLFVGLAIFERDDAPAL